MIYHTTKKTLEYVNGCCNRRYEKACESNPKHEDSACWAQYHSEVKSDTDTYYLLAEMEYGDGNCDIPEDLAAVVKRLRL